MADAAPNRARSAALPASVTELPVMVTLEVGELLAGGQRTALSSSARIRNAGAAVVAG